MFVRQSDGEAPDIRLKEPCLALPCGRSAGAAAAHCEHHSSCLSATAVTLTAGGPPSHCSHRQKDRQQSTISRWSHITATATAACQAFAQAQAFAQPQPKLHQAGVRPAWPQRQPAAAAMASKASDSSHRRLCAVPLPPAPSPATAVLLLVEVVSTDPMAATSRRAQEPSPTRHPNTGRAWSSCRCPLPEQKFPPSLPATTVGHHEPPPPGAPLTCTRTGWPCRLLAAPGPPGG